MAKILGGDQVVIQTLTMSAGTSFGVTDVGAQILAANAERKKFYITNDHAGDWVFVYYSSVPSTSTVVALLAPGGSFHSDEIVWTGVVAAAAVTSSSTVYVVELT